MPDTIANRTRGASRRRGLRRPLVVLGGSAVAATTLLVSVALPGPDDAADDRRGAGVAAAGGRAAAPEVTVERTAIEPSVGSASLDWPDGIDAGAVAIEGVEGAAMRTGAEGTLPMASIAKLLAAAVVLDERPLADARDEGPTIELDDADVEHLRSGLARGASVLPVMAGDELTQRELLEAALLTSASNAADTLVDWAFDDEESYLRAADEWMRTHGVEGVSPADPSGLSRRGVATTEGLLTLMAAVDDDPVLLALSGQRTAEIPRLGEAESSNGALGRAGIDSGKTGSLNRSGRTVLVGATRTIGGEEVRVHAVLLGIDAGVDRDRAIAAVVDRAVANLEVRELVPEGTPVATYAAEWGASMTLETAEPVRMLHWAGAPATALARVPDAAPGPRDPVGSLSVRTGEDRVSVPLVRVGELGAPSLSGRAVAPVAKPAAGRDDAVEQPG